MRLSRSTTITILGTDTLAEDILARLLEREGYNVRHLEAHPRVSMEGLLDGVDLLLTAPGLNAEVRGAFLKAMRSPRKTAAIPVLTIFFCPQGGPARRTLGGRPLAHPLWRAGGAHRSRPRGSRSERQGARD